jgi:hypothetical protein
VPRTPTGTASSQQPLVEKWLLNIEEDSGSSSKLKGDLELVVFKEGEKVEDAGTSRVPPLNAYSPVSEGEGYSDWVLQHANDIYPIVGMTYMGHKLQLLAWLTCIEGDRRNGDGSSKAKREIKNLASSINYDAKGSCSNRGKKRDRALIGVP